MDQDHADSILQYKSLVSEKEDWDNLPALVSRSLIHHEKYISGLSETCKDFMSRETTAELRADLRTGIDSIEDNREEARAIDLVEKK